jgi:hypothetical protein
MDSGFTSSLFFKPLNQLIFEQNDSHYFVATSRKLTFALKIYHNARLQLFRQRCLSSQKRYIAYGSQSKLGTPRRLSWLYRIFCRPLL